MASCIGCQHFSSVQGVRGVRAATGTSTSAPSTHVDYRRVLGVGPKASAREVKAAYRSLALRLHPDVCQGSGCEVSFVEVNRAYESLMALQSQQQAADRAEAVQSNTYSYGFEASPVKSDDDPWSEFCQSLVNGTHEELREDYSCYYSNLRFYRSKASRSKRTFSGTSQYYQN